MELQGRLLPVLQAASAVSPWTDGAAAPGHRAMYSSTPSNSDPRRIATPGATSLLQAAFVVPLWTDGATAPGIQVMCSNTPFNSDPRRIANPGATPLSLVVEL